MNLAQCIDRLVIKHGSLRKAAASCGLDAGYLSRLRAGEKEHPSERYCEALGIEQVISYRMSRQPQRPFPTMTPNNAAAYHGGEDDGL